MTISFTIPGNPPRVTKQQKRIVVRRINGKMVGLHVDTPELKEATAYFQEGLLPYRPRTPFQGPLRLRVKWIFPHPASTPKKHLGLNLPKDTSPDCDNMAKLLVDTMQSMGFFANDGQIACEILEKLWGPAPGIDVSIEEIKLTQPLKELFD